MDWNIITKNLHKYHDLFLFDIYKDLINWNIISNDWNYYDVYFIKRFANYINWDILKSRYYYDSHFDKYEPKTVHYKISEIFEKFEISKKYFIFPFLCIIGTSYILYKNYKTNVISKLLY